MEPITGDEDTDENRLALCYPRHEFSPVCGRPELMHRPAQQLSAVFRRRFEGTGGDGDVEGVAVQDVVVVPELLDEVSGGAVPVWPWSS
ncbi:hypothetical protein AB0C84_11975 [Actinomadura sp. NPDC048955]|uniref:hypothetical protein n=1 Tax=Actinomadura sp. NPDC048955 TaxID=3158228 RepID=UPI003409E73F